MNDYPICHIHFEDPFVVSFIQAVLILIVSLTCQWLSRRPLSNLVGHIDSIWFKDLFIGALLGAALMVLPALLLTIFGFINWQVNAITYSTLVSGLTVFLWVATAEELQFRGFIFQRLIQAFGHQYLYQFNRLRTKKIRAGDFAGTDFYGWFVLLPNNHNLLGIGLIVTDQMYQVNTIG